MTDAQAPAPAKRGESLAPLLSVRVDDGVHFEFNVVNDGSKKLEVKFPSGRTHEIVVFDAAGAEVWRWSEGKMFTQSVQARVLRSNELIELDGEWETPRPGAYRAVATLMSENYPMTAEAGFTVQP